MTVADAIAPAAALAALACVVAAAISDIRRFEIANGLSIAIALLVLPYGVTTPGFSWLSHGGVALAVFAAGVGLFAAGWMGGGDVKLLAAAALWAGVDGLPGLLLGMSISGGLLAAIAVIGRRLVRVDHPYPALRPGGPLPYAVAILGGVVVLAVGRC